MSNFSHHIALPCLLASLVWPIASHAASAPPSAPPAGSTPVPNYVFNVPVNVSGLPLNEMIRVRCVLSYGTQGRQKIIGDWVGVPANTSGSYSGIMMVKVDYKVANDGSWITPNSYECSMDFVKLDGKSGMPPPHTELTGLVRGTL
ncbi:MAG: hypothetical protein WCL29_04475 [Pseudomonadota bacterium]